MGGGVGHHGSRDKKQLNNLPGLVWGCVQWATRLLLLEEEGAEQLMMLCVRCCCWLLLLLQEKLPSKAKRPVGRPRKGTKQ